MADHHDLGLAGVELCEGCVSLLGSLLTRKHVDSQAHLGQLLCLAQVLAHHVRALSCRQEHQAGAATGQRAKIVSAASCARAGGWRREAAVKQL